jgi:hypothetical protein
MWAKTLLITKPDRMNRAFFILIISTLFYGCSKVNEKNLWEKTFGTGKAIYVKNMADSGTVSCGVLDGKKYLLVLDQEKKKISQFKSEDDGIYTSLLIEEGAFLTGGISGSRMNLSKIGINGDLLWDTVFTTTFDIGHTSLCNIGNGEFLAVGSASADSLTSSSTGLCFVLFNSSGDIISRDDKPEIAYIAANDIVADNSGNLYLALTRQGTGIKQKATVAKYNNQFQKLWEKELYNNPAFGAASLGLAVDNSDNLLITGRTELQVSSGIEDNTFVIKYMPGSDSLTKKYLEYANSGSSVIQDGTGQIIILNMRCLIINILDQDLNVTGIIRTYSSCDSQNTDTFGYSMDITGDGDAVIAGSRGNNYYLAIKSLQELSPV